MRTNSYGKILIHALVNLGDVVLATSAAALIKKIHPEARVTMMVRPFAEEIVRNNPVVDDVIIFGYQAKKKSWRDMWEMVHRLKQEHFDICFSMDRKLRPALLTWLAGIPVRVVPERIFDDKPSRITWFYTDVIPMPRSFLETPQAENFQSVIRGFFKRQDVHAKPVIGIPDEASRQRAAALWQELPPAPMHVALCVKGSFPLKTWPKEHFLRLMRMLHEKYGANFFIIGAPGDTAYAEEFVREYEGEVCNFCGKTSLMDLVGIFSRSDLFVTVDTGALHIAATTGVPIVAMYGCGPSKRWPPLTERSRCVTTNEKCSPCHIPADACPTNPRPKCQWNITPELVMTACEELL